jgi:uncharacterized protein (TIGR03000 family)
VTLPNGVGVLFSCKAGQRAFETARLARKGTKGHGVFFYHVLEGLEGKARTGDGEVTWDSLGAYVRREVPRRVPELIGGGARQSPHALASIEGEPPVLLRPGAAAAVTGKSGTAEKEVTGEEQRDWDAYLAKLGETEKKEATNAWKGAGLKEKRELLAKARAYLRKGSEDGKKNEPATLVILVPEGEDVKLEIGGQTVKQTGARRRFVSPPLEPGKRYFYSVSARWEPNNYTTITRTRKVYVTPGKESEVDLRKRDPLLPDHIVIRYVPTPAEVVDAMMKLGGVGKGDVVYDLGCGDGRLVVTAVAKFNAKRGVGVDLDPQRVKESVESARKAGVSAKVEFRQGDVMKVEDLEKATVVMLYLSDDLNEQLRPILQKALKPGARVVSHRFRMGGWKPDETKAVAGEDGNKYEIHLWKIKES